MPPFSNQSAGLFGRYSIFQGPARSGLLERVYSIIERDLALWILLDIVTTGLALKLGAFEANPGAAHIMSIHPALWVAGLLGILVLAVGTGRALSRYYKNNIGLCLIVIAVLIECQAVINNFGVIGTML